MGDDSGDGETIRVRAKDLTGRTALVTVSQGQTVDQVRASVALALGHGGCRARLLLNGGSGREISGDELFRDARASIQLEDTEFTVLGYVRVSTRKHGKDAVSKNGVPKSRHPALQWKGRRAGDEKETKTKPPGSPGRARRNYIMETGNDDKMRGCYTDGNVETDDFLAAPFGGHGLHKEFENRAGESRLEKNEKTTNGNEKNQDVRFETADPNYTRDQTASHEMWVSLREEAARVVFFDRSELPRPATDPHHGRGGSADWTETGREKEPEEKRIRKPKPKPKPNPKKPKVPIELGVSPAVVAEVSPGVTQDLATTEPTPDDGGLPDCLATLAAAYDATAKMCGFLKHQRVRSTWRQIEQAVKSVATLNDLYVIEKLCPRALVLKERQVIAMATLDLVTATATESVGDPQTSFTDLLVEVHDASAARFICDAEDETFRVGLDFGFQNTTQKAGQRHVVHGARTSRATYGVGGEEDPGLLDARRSTPVISDAIKTRATKKKPVAGDAFARCVSGAFRACLGKLVLGEVDFLIDHRGMTSDEAWGAVSKAQVEVFIKRAAASKKEVDETLAKAKSIKNTPPVSHGTTHFNSASLSHGTKRKPSTRVRLACDRCDVLDVEQLIEHLVLGAESFGGARNGGTKGCVEYRRDEEARDGKYCSQLHDKNLLSPATRRALKHYGSPGGVSVDRVYTHQSTAIQSVLGGNNTVVATGTASGKSLCYVAPAFQFLLADPNATALFLFPTKALARDQVGKLLKMCKAACEVVGGSNGGGSNASPHPFDIGVFDGDTSQTERLRIKAESRLVVTNPDTLHCTFLPNHAREFSDFFKGLKIVVLDEAHVYRGVFGSHVSLVIRRLRRVCREVYGVDPVFVVASATIDTPGQHAMALCGDFESLDAEGGRRDNTESELRTQANSDRCADGTTQGTTQGVTLSESKNQRWQVVTQDGSPKAAKTFVMWNPPEKQWHGGDGTKTKKKRKSKEPKGKAATAAKLLAKQRTERAVEPATTTAIAAQLVNTPLPRTAQNPMTTKHRSSPIVEIARLLVECVRHDLRVIAFCKTKKLCELVLRYARDLLLNSGGAHLLETVRAYRGGYTSQDRRNTEQGLFSGALRGVCATNALELGVDVGVLDVTLHLGFPGSVSSLTQQAGRAGRRGKKALSIYVAFDSPIDQYFVKHPEKLFSGATLERAAVDFENSVILQKHLECAAYELALDPRVEGEDAVTYFSSSPDDASSPRDVSPFRDAVDQLVRALKLGRDPRIVGGTRGDLRLQWIGVGNKTPASSVSVRTIEDEKFEVVDIDSNNVLEEIEQSKAFHTVYPGAVYLNQARTFLVTKLDLEKRVAFVRRADVKYFTSAINHTKLELTTHAGSKHAYPDRPMGVHQVGYGQDLRSITSGQDWESTQDLQSTKSTTTTTTASTSATKSTTCTSMGSSAQVSKCAVTVSFAGFKKIHQATGTAFDFVDFRKDLHLQIPDVSFDTVACWLRVPETARVLTRKLNIAFEDAAHAASHAVINALPLVLLVNHADVGVECFGSNRDAHEYAPKQLLLYDKHPGGVGIAQRTAGVFLKLMRLALELVQACDCGDVDVEGVGVDEDTIDDEIEIVSSDDESKTDRNNRGCPGCTHYMACDFYNDRLHKQGAVVVLRETIRVEEERLLGLIGAGFQRDARSDETEKTEKTETDNETECVFVDGAKECCAAQYRKRGKCVGS